MKNCPWCVQRSTVAQKCLSNFNLLTAISICSRQLQQQFQFVHSNFNLLKAISICSQQLQQQFQFAHGNFISVFHGNAILCYSIFRFAHYLSTMAADSSYQTSIKTQNRKSIFKVDLLNLLLPENYKLYLTILFTAQHLKMVQSLTLI